MAKKKRKRKTQTKLKKKRTNKQPNGKYKELHEKTKNVLNHSGLPTEEIEFIDPPDGVKMSAVILKLAEPLLKEYGDDDKRIEAIISLTIIVWNKLMFPSDVQENLYDEMIDHLVPMNGDAEDISSIVYLTDMITKRKNVYFPDLKKIIISYDLSVSKGDITLNISSAQIRTPQRH